MHIKRLDRMLLTGCILALCVSAATGEPLIDGLSRASWAQKLPGGPMKVVFLAPYGAQHDSFELMQRFEIDGAVVTMASMDTQGYHDGLEVIAHYWPDIVPTRQDILKEIRGALATEWDAVVMSGFPTWPKYPADIRRAILEKVASGRGLLVRGLDSALIKELETMGLKLEETSIGAGRFPFRTGKNGAHLGQARVYRCGKGRVVRFKAFNHPAHGYLLSDSHRQSDFEFSAARAGWFLRRATRPDARSYVTGTRFADGDIVVELDAAARAPDGGVHVAVHRRDRYEKVLNVRTTPKPGKPVTVALPQLPGGDYQAEVRVMDREGVTLDWDAVRFTVTGSVRLEQFTVDPGEDLEPGDNVTCRLEVVGDTAGLETVARWYDQWDRLLFETAAEPFAQDMQVTAPAGSLSVLNRLEVTIRSDRGPEAIGSVELLMPANVRPTDYHMLYWRTITWNEYAPESSWRGRLQWDVLRRDGAADAWANARHHGPEARTAALSHLRTVPYATSLAGLWIDGEGKDSLLNEQYMAGMEKRARGTARAFRPYNPLAYTLGDENSMNHEHGRFADTPRVWEKFSEYLRGVYPDLGALNTQWGTDFAAWNAIRFDNEGQMLPDMDNPSAWVDYRMFITREFTAVHRRMRQAIREEHPGAGVGWDGVEQYPYGGQDWWELCQDMEMVNTYIPHLDPDVGQPGKIFNGEAIGSFGHDAPLRGCWMNRADREYGSEYEPWYLLLNGWNSTWWWQATYLHPANGPLTWDLRLTPMAEPMVEAVNEIKQGPGTLLAHARKVVSPIAVHYSALNHHASTIESGIGSHPGNRGYGVAFWASPALTKRGWSNDEQMKRLWGNVSPKGHCSVAAANFYIMLHDLGFEPRTMARQEIEAGALTVPDTRVLILPFAVALSDVEVEKIRQFVAEGGYIIADYRCGLRDGHGRLRDKPALDDVFGITRQSLVVHRGRAKVTADLGLPAARPAIFETMFREPVVRAGAEAMGVHDDGTQAFFMRRQGRGGAAVYLNADVYSYVDLRRRGQGRRMRQLFASLFTRVDCRNPDNRLLPTFPVKNWFGMELTWLRDGETSYYGVLPAYDVDNRAPRPVTLPFPGGTHVYDVRARKYLGPGGPIDDTLYPGKPRMYAALRYKVAGVSVVAPPTARRGEPIEITIDVAAEADELGPHATRVEVSLPGGRKPEYLSRTLYLPNGQATWSFVPALNSPPGFWTVTAVEAVSGMQATARVNVN